MNEYDEVVLDHNVSSLIQSQFPDWYKEQGPVLVEFVKEYFRWLEGSQVISDNSFSAKGYVHVNAGNTTVIGEDGVDFLSYFANGDQIALYKQDDETDYTLATINVVSSSNTITLTTAPDFSSSNSWYTPVYRQYNPNYYLRRFLEEKDIDLTTSDFLVYFKEKYLKNIQFQTQTNIRTLLKHALDIYRSKGTERCVDLLFRAVFGLPASVYYPGDDIFRLSDGKWYQPVYLEISIRKDSELLVGKQIYGGISGALGFVEALVRRTVKGRLIDVLYVSAVKGNFFVDEPINSIDRVLSPGSQCPIVTGSLTGAIVDLEGTGANYAIGDVVDISSNFGEQAKGKVTAIANTTGQVTFELVNGGYGYRYTANVLVSEKILTISNLRIANTNNGKNYVYNFDQMVEPLANIVYSNITSNLVAGDMVFSYTGGNVLDGTGVVLESHPNTATTGYLWLSVLSGNLNHATIYTTANAKSITKSTYTNATCIANVIGYYSNVNIGVASKTGSFLQNEEVYQVDQYGLELANASFLSFTPGSGLTGQLLIGNTYGVFQTGRVLRGRLSNASANVQNTALFVGVIGMTNTAYSTTNNYTYFANSGSNGTITNISAGSLANVGFSNSLLYTETVSLANDYIRDYKLTALNAAVYNFPSFPSGNLTNGTLAQMFANQTYTIGKVQQLIGINKGTDYNLPPIVKIYDPVIAAEYKQDVFLNVTGVSGVFKVGEIVTQTTPGSRGIIKKANTTQIQLEQLRINPSNNFVVTTTTNTKLVGAESLAVANVTSVVIDLRSEYLGYNANIVTRATASPGAVTGLSIIASGFGYKKADGLRFVKTGHSFDDVDAGFAIANVFYQGQAEGYYKRKGGWLSDQSKLFDGIYYQEYSYEVRSSITLQKYEEMLKQILHPAGTKYFGAVVYRSYVAANAEFNSTHITQA